MTVEYVDAGEAIDQGLLSGKVAVGEVAPPVVAGFNYDRILNAREEPQNWLTYYGAYDGQLYSPLDQLNTENVKRLLPAWIFQAGTTNFGTTLFRVRYRRNGTQPQVQIQVGTTANTNWINISNTSHRIEVVWPAAGFPLMAKRNNASLAIINREATEFDAIADLVIRDDIGTVLSPFIAH